MRYNFRLPLEDTWLYVEHVLNVGLFAAFKPSVFRHTEPKKRYEHLVDLYRFG